MWTATSPKKILVDGVPKITLSRDFARRMKHIVDTTPTEVSWVGEVEGDPRADLLVTNLHIMKQKVSSATFEEEDNAFVELKSRIGDAVYKIRCHAHSHVGMQTNPSGTDQKHTVDNWRELEVPFLIRMIANKKGDLRVDFFDFERGISVECADFKIADEPLAFPDVDAQLKEYLSPLPVATVHHMMGGGPVSNLTGPNGKPGSNGKPDADDFWLYDDTDEPWWRSYMEQPEESEAEKQAKARKFAHFWRGVW